MASHADDLKSRERLRWGCPTKVYTRKRRRIQKKDDPIPISAAPDVNKGSSKDANGYVVQAGELESAEESERLQYRPEEEEPQLKDSLPCDLELEDGRDRDQVELINGGQGQDDTLGSQGDLDGREVANVGGSPIVEANNGGDVRGEEAAMASYTDGLTREHAELDSTVKPVISRVRDRIRINIGGATSRVEIRGIRRDLAGELDQIRSLVIELEAKELQLTTHDTNTNGGFNNVGRITTIPSGAVNSNSQPRYIDNGVMNSRALVRVNSEMGLVGNPGSRPFQRPRVAVVENNNVVAEFVEKEKRTPKANQYYTNSEFLLGKDRLPPESNKKFKPNGAGRKHNGELEQGYPFGVGFGFDKHRNQVFKRCTTLLQRLMKHKHGWVFNEPVNVEGLGLHDYHAIIKHPMDLGTIKARLSQNRYKSPREFAEDVRLVFRNAMTYNPKGHDVHVMSEQLLKIFEERWAVIEGEFNPDWRYQMYHDAGLPTPTSRKVPQPSPFARASVTSHAAPPASQARTLDRSESMTGPADFRFKPSRVAHVGRVPVPKKPKANDPDKRDMTYEEKQRLSTHLQSLPLEKLDAVVQIIKKRNSTFYQHDDVIEVDIDSVDAESLWELERFVTNYKKNLSKQKRKTELAQQARGTTRTAPVMNTAPMVAGALNSNTVQKREDRWIMQAVPVVQAVPAAIQVHRQVILIAIVPLDPDLKRAIDVKGHLAQEFFMDVFSCVLI
ncbi:hypothetical protein H5410_058912 [Solanum commersonii]|uniref:Bromodomain-containing protein n=1 Tax=Solanum commersonii TaxID=4109 RepID=A0A9J5W139_SOLCO|nr:hypothetical protein H5410_058912 [Solanum commersonii]